jgi:hypothetical protein
VGVSVEDQDRLHRIDELKDTPAAVHFVSIEPLLEQLGALVLDGIEWVIVGGESGPGARPCALEWVSGIVQQCRSAAVPVFVKQLGAFVVSEGRTSPAGTMANPTEALRHYRAPNGDVWAWRDGLSNRKGGDMSEWPDDLRVRQFPPSSTSRHKYEPANAVQEV